MKTFPANALRCNAPHSNLSADTFSLWGSAVGSHGNQKYADAQLTIRCNQQQRDHRYRKVRHLEDSCLLYNFNTERQTQVLVAMEK